MGSVMLLQFESAVVGRLSGPSDFSKPDSTPDSTGDGLRVSLNAILDPRPPRARGEALLGVTFMVGVSTLTRILASADLVGFIKLCVGRTGVTAAFLGLSKKQLASNSSSLEFSTEWRTELASPMRVPVAEHSPCF